MVDLLSGGFQGEEEELRESFLLFILRWMVDLILGVLQGGFHGHPEGIQRERVVGLAGFSAICSHVLVDLRLHLLVLVQIHR